MGKNIFWGDHVHSGGKSAILRLFRYRIFPFYWWGKVFTVRSFYLLESNKLPEGFVAYLMVFLLCDARFRKANPDHRQGIGTQTIWFCSSQRNAVAYKRTRTPLLSKKKITQNIESSSIVHFVFTLNQNEIQHQWDNRMNV